MQPPLLAPMPPRRSTPCLVLLLLSMLGVPESRGQNGPAVPVDSVREAYAQLDYERAEELGRSALEAFERYSLGELAEVHTILGFIAFARNDLEGARSAFRSALDLEPSLTLDPRLVSPRIIELFDAVRRSAEEPARAGPASIRYVVVPDRRSSAVLRSLALPGWGQLHLQEPRKGWLLVGLWGTVAAGTVASHLQYRSARTAYLDERSASRVGERGERMDLWYKVRNNLAIGAAGIWLFSVGDALAHGKPLSGAIAAPGRSDISVVPGGFLLRVGIGGR